jgi:hypothetical protein
VRPCPTPAKVAHHSEVDARVHLAALRRVGGSPDLTVYRCGGHWHVGHSQVRLRKRIRAVLARARLT